MANRLLEIILGAKDDASATIGKVENKVSSFGANVATIAKAAAAALGAIALGEFFKSSVEGAADAEKKIALLGQAVGNAGADFNRLKPALSDAIEGIKRLTVYSGEDLTGALTDMITVTGDVAASTKNLGLAADLATAKHVSLAEAGHAVAKAMTGNMKALNDMGVAGVDANQALDILRGSIGGLAEKEASTFSGKLGQLNVQWDDFKQAVGGAIIGTGEAGGALGGLTEMLATAAQWISNNSEVLGSFAAALLEIGRFVAPAVGLALKGILEVVLVLEEGLGSFLKWMGDVLGKKELFNTGDRMVDAAVIAMDKLTSKQVETQQATTAHELVLTKVEQDAAAERAAHQKGALADKAAREKEAQAAAKKQQATFDAERIKQEDAIAVLQLVREAGVTEEVAKELIRRRRLFFESTEEQQNQLLKLWQTADDAARGPVQRFIESLGTWKAKVVDATGSTNDFRTAQEKLNDKAYDLLLTEGKLYDEFGRINDVANASSGTIETAGKTGEKFHDAAGAVRSFADNIGDASDASHKALGNLLDVAGAITTIQGGDPSAIVNAVGTIVGAIGRLFGPSPEAAAQRAMIEKNTASIDRLRAVNGTLADLNTPGHTFEAMNKALGDFLGGQREGRARGFGDRPVSVAELRPFLMSQGMTVTQLRDMAKDLGIDLGEKNGTFSPQALQQVLMAVGLAHPGFGEFSYSGQRAATKAGIQGGILTAGDEYAGILNAIARTGGSAINDALRKVDVSTGTGRNEALLQMRHLLDDLVLGNTTAAQMGGLTFSEFQGAIQDLIAILANQDITGIYSPTGVNPPGVGTPGGAVVPDPFADLATSFDDIGTKQVDYLASIDDRLGAVLDRWTDIDTGLPGGVVKPGGGSLLVGDIAITVNTGAGDPAAIGAAVRDELVAGLNQILGARYRDQQSARGIL